MEGTYEKLGVVKRNEGGIEGFTLVWSFVCPWKDGDTSLSTKKVPFILLRHGNITPSTSTRLKPSVNIEVGEEDKAVEETVELLVDLLLPLNYSERPDCSFFSFLTFLPSTSQRPPRKRQPGVHS